MQDAKREALPEYAIALETMGFDLDQFEKGPQYFRGMDQLEVFVDDKKIYIEDSQGNLLKTLNR